jgi:hypothetical protein
VSGRRKVRDRDRESKRGRKGDRKGRKVTEKEATHHPSTTWSVIREFVSGSSRYNLAIKGVRKQFVVLETSEYGSFRTSQGLYQGKKSRFQCSVFG